jgi:hypothetical protein
MLFQNSQPQDSGRKDNTKGALAEADAHFQYSGQAEAGTKKKKPRAASDTQGFYRIPRASIEMVRIRFCRVGSDALQLNLQ